MPMTVLLLLSTLTLALALTLARGILAVPAFADTSSLTIASERYLAGDSVSLFEPRRVWRWLEFNSYAATAL
ncbi:hypothetical protein IP70_11275, partial [alpha proteobacterium AAP38]